MFIFERQCCGISYDIFKFPCSGIRWLYNRFVISECDTIIHYTCLSSPEDGLKLFIVSHVDLYRLLRNVFFTGLFVKYETVMGHKDVTSTDAAVIWTSLFIFRFI